MQGASAKDSMKLINRFLMGMSKARISGCLLHFLGVSGSLHTRATVDQERLSVREMPV